VPRLYVTPTMFPGHTAGITFSFQVAQLQAISGALDQLLSRASSRVDAYCRKRVQAPGVTTVGTGGIAAGATSLPVASTLAFDDGHEQAIVLGSGGTQEIVPLVSGPVEVTSWSSPYPGILHLAQGAAYAHSAGEAVQGCYQEISEIGSSSSSDVYSESFLDLNQDAQLARAHAPHGGTGTLVRALFLKQYPITKLLNLEIMLPIDSAFESMDISNVTMNPAAGLLKLPLGSFVLPEGKSRTTYTAGYTSVPEAAQAAAAWYAADELQTMISMGAYEMQEGRQKGKYGDARNPQAAKSLYEQRAENVLDNAGLRRRT
jgi:hypothetical protein